MTLTGTGQGIGLVEFDGYAEPDIAAYETAGGLPNVAVSNELIGGFSGTPSSDENTRIEVCLDIEMAISMARGAEGVFVFEADQAAGAHRLA